MRVSLLSTVVCCFAFGAEAYQDCKTAFPTDTQLEQRLTCLQNNTDEVKAAIDRLRDTLAGKFKIQTLMPNGIPGGVCIVIGNASPGGTANVGACYPYGPGNPTPTPPIGIWRLLPQ